MININETMLPPLVGSTFRNLGQSILGASIALKSLQPILREWGTPTLPQYSGCGCYGKLAWFGASIGESITEGATGIVVQNGEYTTYGKM